MNPEEIKVWAVWAAENKAHDHAKTAVQLKMAIDHLASFKPVHHRYSANPAIQILRREAASHLWQARKHNVYITRSVLRHHKTENV